MTRLQTAGSVNTTPGNDQQALTPARGQTSANGVSVLPATKGPAAADTFAVGAFDKLPVEVRYLCMAEVASAGRLGTFSRTSRGARFLACSFARDELIQQNNRTVNDTVGGRVPALSPAALSRYEACASLLKDVTTYAEETRTGSLFPKHPTIDKAALFHWERREVSVGYINRNALRGISRGILSRQERAAWGLGPKSQYEYVELMDTMSHVSRSWRSAVCRFAVSAVRAHANKVAVAARSGRVLIVGPMDVYAFERSSALLMRMHTPTPRFTAENLFDWGDKEARLLQQEDELDDPDYDVPGRASEILLRAKAENRQDVDLDGRCMMSLPRGIGGLTFIRQLQLGENRLDLPNIRLLAPLVNLRHLDMYGCDLETLDGAECLRSLERLEIGNTNVTRLWPLRDLPCLSYLAVSPPADGREPSNAHVLLRLPLTELSIPRDFVVPDALHDRKSLRFDWLD